MLLRQHRVAAGLSQEQLAERAGLSRRGISDLERGARQMPYPDTLRRLADELGLSNKDRAAMIGAARQRQWSPTTQTKPDHRTSKTAPRPIPRADPSNVPTFSSTFVGRDSEIAALLGHLQSAAGGMGGIVLLAGEPGVGKTRLMHEMGKLALAQGWEVLFGRGYDTDGVPPYLPFVEAMQEHADGTTVDELRQQLGPFGADVVPLLPELRAKLRPASRNDSADPDELRYRLFEGVAGFLVRIAQANSRGLVLCLDDLHWADKPTLLLLQHLARKLKRARVLIIGTYRTVELGPKHALTDLLADLSREQLYHPLSLGPFSPREAFEFVEAVNGSAPAPEVANAIYRGTEGNAFFLGEVVRHLRKEGLDLTDPEAAVADWGMPDAVRQVITKRVSRTSEACNALLHLGSVLGEGFTFDVLRSLNGAFTEDDESILLDALEEALAGGLLREEGLTYHFKHALIRQALYADFSLARRQRQHLRVGEALERLFANNLHQHVPELAHHFSVAATAGGAERAVTYARRAGDQARSVAAFEESVRFYELALAALDVIDVQPSAARCDLLLALCEVMAPAGQSQRLAEEVAEKAFSMAETLGDKARAVRSAYLALVQGLRRYGGGTIGDSPLTRRWVARLDAFATEGSRERVEADFWMGIFLLAGEGSWETGWTRIDRARSAARESKDPEILALPWDVAGWFTPRRLIEHLATDTESGVADFVGISPRASAELLTMRNWTCRARGDRDGADQTWAQLNDLAMRSREAPLLLEPLSHEGHVALLEGDLERAIEVGKRTIARAEELGSPVLGRYTAYLFTFRPLLYLGRAEEALTAAFSARDRGGWSDQPSYFRVGERALCLAYARRFDEAHTRLCQDLEFVEICRQTPVRILAALLETAILLKDSATATRLALQLEGVVAFGAPLMNLALILGDASALTGDRKTARAHYERGLEWATSLRHRPETARARLALGELSLAEALDTGIVAPERAQRRAEARFHLDFAIEDLHAMKMQPLLAHALRLPGYQRTDVHAQHGVADRGRFSRRELEVLRLVAAGKTNAEIGETLAITVNTVGRHVSSIFAKIGVTNRAGATNWAVRRTLLDSE
jgi:DNA-binding CsgD family transcriptional regulator